MRTVEVSRLVRAGPAVVDRLLTPAAIVEYEGSFAVREVEERPDGWLVHAGSRGLELSIRFEPLDDGFYYEFEGDEAPIETMETTLQRRPENEGTRVSAVSDVEMGVRPSTVTDRIAAWKRKGELERALEALAADAE